MLRCFQKTVSLAIFAALFVTIATSVHSPNLCHGQQLLYSMIPAQLSDQYLTYEGDAIAFNEQYRVAGKTGANLDFDEVGAVEVYDASGNHLHTIWNPTPSNNGGFGKALALNGHILVVGTLHAGEATVYDLDSTTPAEPVIVLKSPEGSHHIGFGGAVAIDGNTIAVGGDYIRENHRNYGVVYTYNLLQNVPTIPVMSLRDSNTSYGNALAMDSGRLVIGSDEQAKIFDLASTDPDSPLYVFDNPAPNHIQDFATSLSIHGDKFVVGSGHTLNGAVFVYDLNASDPTIPIANLISPNTSSTLFGSRATASIHENKILVGQSELDVLGGREFGGAFLYDLESPTPEVAVYSLIDPSPEENGHYGNAVAISGNLAIVGSPGNDSHRGATYEYDLTSQTPEISTATLSLLTENADGQNFGGNVAMSGDTFVVSSINEHIGAFSSGAVYVFKETDAKTGVPTFIVPNPMPSKQDQFGTSIAIDEDILVVGSTNRDNMGNAYGEAFVFDLASPSPLTPIVTLTGPTPLAGERFGYNLAVSENLVFVSCEQERRRGVVYVYDLTSLDPTVPSMTIPNPQVVGFFGCSLAVCGKRLAVGSYYGFHGSAFVYDLDSTTPTTPVYTTNIPGIGWNPDGLGHTVAIQDNLLIVGAPQNFGPYNDPVGGAFAFDIDNPSPNVPIVTFKLHDPLNGVIGFGTSVAIMGTKVFVGQPNRGGRLGQVVVYELNSETPDTNVLVFGNTVKTRSLLDNFGAAMAVDGNRLFVGASSVFSIAESSGAAFVYEFATETVVADSIEIIKGQTRSGDVQSLVESDNVDLSLSRNPVMTTASIEVDVKGVAPTDTPTAFSFTIEASVFSRREISQTVSLFNYDTSQFEIVDLRPASRFTDQVTTVAANDNLSRFVEDGTLCIKAKIEFKSAINRAQFTANIDQMIWSVE